jgi:hypothetical protein
MSKEQVIKEIGSRREPSAHSNGWEDGRFGLRSCFLRTQTSHHGRADGEQTA